MNSYSAILKNMTYSYSSVHSFEQCPYSFKLSYIKNAPRVSNAFAEFGGFMHDILEKYFSGEIMLWDLLDYYTDNYKRKVKILYPPNQYVDLGQTYYNFGLEFFENFDFPLENYDIHSIEKTIRFSLGGYKFSARPDLILTDKESHDKILFDYKTERIKTTKKEKAKQLEKIMNQMQLYAYALGLNGETKVDEMRIWFIRDGIFHTEKTDDTKINASLSWALNTINAVQSETEWQPTNTKENDFFCRYLCGVRGSCKYIDNPSP